MATETKYPDGTVWTLTGWTGTTTVDRVDSAPDGTWLLSDQASATEIIRASFPSPTGNLNTGAGLQTFRVYVRTTGTGSGQPYLTIGVRETGDTADLANNGTIQVSTGQTGAWYSFTWDASLLNDGLDGAAVEIYLHTEDHGGGGNKNWLDIDSIEWIADYTATIPVTVTPSGVGATGSVGSVTTGISKTLAVSGLSATGSPGTATVSAKANVTVTGLAGTAAIDSVTVAGKATVTVSGVAATGSPGTVTTGISKTQVVTGLAATAAVDSVTVQAVQAPTVVVTGLQATGSVEPVTILAGLTVSVTGLAATGQVTTPSVTADANLTLSGVSGTAAVGSVTVDTGAVTWEQEGFRFRNDDGSETTATWIVAQDSNINMPAEMNIRLRVLTLASNNPPGTTATLQYRKVGDADWHTIE